MMNEERQEIDGLTSRDLRVKLGGEVWELTKMKEIESSELTLSSL
jgi:hypothetical protein